MFKIEKTKNIDSTTLNNKYNQMLTEIKGERGISNEEKKTLYSFLEQAFKKLLERDDDYKLTEGDFMPNLEKNTIFSENNPVIKKEITKEINNVINPLKTEHVTKVLNINTLFRKNYYGQSSTDFIIDLPNTIRNVKSISLIKTDIPDNTYTFSSKRKTNEFNIETFWSSSQGANDTREKKIFNLKIKNGNYTPQQLVKYLNTEIFSPTNPADLELKMVGVIYDEITKKIVFFRDMRPQAENGLPNEVGKHYSFNIDWLVGQKNNNSAQLNMGWILGFRKGYYRYREDYVLTKNASYNRAEGFEAESCYSGPEDYIFLSIDDYNNNFAKSMLSPFENSIINDDHIFAKINRDGDYFKFENCDVDVIYKRNYFGPINLMKLRIRLLDKFGRVIDLNKSDYSFTLKLEQIYDSRVN
jgi:hypothetical protein